MAVPEGLTAEITFGAPVEGVAIPPWVTPDTHRYRVVLSYENREMIVPFYCGPLAGEPTLNEILECLASDASAYRNATGGYYDWCDEYGMTPSRESQATYDAVAQQSGALLVLLGPDFDRVLYPDQ